MLPKDQRFHTQGAVRRVMQHGKPARGRYVMVKSSDSKYPTIRVAVIVSKKIYKSAVKRNRIRRRIYNIVRHEISHHKSSKDIAITVFSPEVLVIEHATLQAELKTLLQSSIYRD